MYVGTDLVGILKLIVMTKNFYKKIGYPKLGKLFFKYSSILLAIDKCIEQTYSLEELNILDKKSEVYKWVNEDTCLENLDIKTICTLEVELNHTFLTIKDAKQLKALKNLDSLIDLIIEKTELYKTQKQLLIKKFEDENKI